MTIMRSYIRDTDPWWFRAAYVLGVPTIIACFLIWILAWRVDNSLISAAVIMTSHVAQMDLLLANQQQILSVMQQICVNQAATPAGRTACLKGGQ